MYPLIAAHTRKSVGSVKMSEDKDKRNLILFVLNKWDQRKPKSAFLSFPIAALTAGCSTNFIIEVSQLTRKVIYKDAKTNQCRDEKNHHNYAYE